MCADEQIVAGIAGKRERPENKSSGLMWYLTFPSAYGLKLSMPFLCVATPAMEIVPPVGALPTTWQVPQLLASAVR